MAAISYDSVSVLKSFAGRKNISFPLLSDAGSNVIREFGILNETVKPGTSAYGIPHPGTYIIDPKGVIAATYFEDDYRERVSASDILVRQFGDTTTDASATVQGKHVRLTTSASMPVARPGQRIVLSVELELKPKLHVYAPGVEGYIPIAWTLDAGTQAKPHPFTYPPSRKLRLKAIGETVPVYEGKLRLTREITFAQENALRPLLVDGKVILKGSFRYQACDDKVCYPPEMVPLVWTFPFEPMVRERAPAELQKK